MAAKLQSQNWCPLEWVAEEHEASFKKFQLKPRKFQDYYLDKNSTFLRLEIGYLCTYWEIYLFQQSFGGPIKSHYFRLMLQNRFWYKKYFKLLVYNLTTRWRLSWVVTYVKWWTRMTKLKIEFWKKIRKIIHFWRLTNHLRHLTKLFIDVV